MMRVLIRRIGLRNIISLVLLLVAVNSLTAGLGTIISGATMSAFVPVGTAAALLGWWLASTRSREWLAWLAILALGLLLLSSSTAQLGGPLLDLARLLPSVLYQLFLWAYKHIQPDLSAVAAAWGAVVAPYVILWQRVAVWLKGLQSGVDVYDPVVRVLVWSLLLWPMAAWAGWFLRRRHTLTGMAPALTLLAIVGDYTGANPGPLWSLLCVTLLLMGLMQNEAHVARWQSRGMDYAEIIEPDTILAVVAVSIALAVATWFVPSFSLKAITDALRPQEPVNSNHSLADTLGLQAAAGEASPFAPYRAPGLPNEHLIGAGPQLSRMLVMTISTGELPPVPTDALSGVVPIHHWRSTTFDGYTGTGWISGPVDSVSYSANVAVSGPIPSGYRILKQTITLAAKSDGKLYWDGDFVSANRPYEAGWRIHPGSVTALAHDPLQGGDLLGALSGARQYQVESLIPEFSQARLRATPAVYPNEIANRYLNLPKSLPERVLALARELTATAPTPYDRALAIETYLRSNYPYTLDIPAPPADQDVVDYFLFDLKKGYCDYFASSMAVLARAAGLPSRIVVGYASGHYDPYKAEYDISQADAHAWTEIYFSGIGWIEFEPTPNQPGIGRPAQSSTAGNLPAALTPPDGAQALDLVLQSLRGLAVWSTYALIGLALLAGLLQIAEYWVLTSFSGVGAIRWIYRGVFLLGRGLAGPALRGETPSEFAATLQAKLNALAQDGRFGRHFAACAAELGDLTRLYLLAMYAHHVPHRTEIRRALQTWQKLRWRLLLARWVPRAA